MMKNKKSLIYSVLAFTFKMIFIVLLVTTFLIFSLTAQEGGENSRGTLSISSDWDFELIQEDNDIKTNISIINDSVLELTVFAQQNLPGNYKWDMAICNITGFDSLQYMEEDAQGGFDNAFPIDVNYGELINFGMDSSLRHLNEPHLVGVVLDM